MKKAYAKPEILFENFSASTSIAAGCDVKTSTFASDPCGLEFGPDTIFLVNMNGCSDQYEDGTYGDYPGYDKLCYHTPFGDNLFNS